MRTLAIANQKGGCGKTTVAINLSATLARDGRRVLLVDMDPQGHCGVGLAVPENQVDLSILDCLMSVRGDEPVELSRITWQITPALDLAPSCPELARLDRLARDQADAETLLDAVLHPVAGVYDYCVIDCPPHLGTAMRNAIRVADMVVVPVDTGYFSLHGLTRQLTTLKEIAKCQGREIAQRVLANQYDVRTKLAREILAELRSRFGDAVFETHLNFNTKLKEGSSFGQPITEFAPNSMGARDFQRLAREIIGSEPARTVDDTVMLRVEQMAAEAERLLATTATLIGPRHDDPIVNVPPREAQVVALATEASSPAATLPVAGSPSASLPRHARPAPAPHPVRVRDADPVAASNSVKDGAAMIAEPSVPSPASPEAIDDKLERIYGVRQTPEGVIFCSNHPGAAEVQLAGDFNNWMPHTTPMTRVSGSDDFVTTVKLRPGRYRYRLVVDGRWSYDRRNPNTERNAYGELNSIVEIA